MVQLGVDNINYPLIGAVLAIAFMAVGIYLMISHILGRSTPIELPYHPDPPMWTTIKYTYTEPAKTHRERRKEHRARVRKRRRQGDIF